MAKLLLVTPVPADYREHIFDLAEEGHEVFSATNLLDVTTACDANTFDLAVLAPPTDPVTRRRTVAVLHADCPDTPVLEILQEGDHALPNVTASIPFSSGEQKAIAMIRAILRSQDTRAIGEG